MKIINDVALLIRINVLLARLKMHQKGIQSCQRIIDQQSVRTDALAKHAALLLLELQSSSYCATEFDTPEPVVIIETPSA